MMAAMTDGCHDMGPFGFGLRLLQAFARRVQALLHGVGLDREQLCDLLQRLISQVVQRHDQALALGQRIDRRAQPARALRRERQLFAVARRCDRLGALPFPSVDPLAAIAPVAVLAQHRVKPGEERVRGAQLGQVRKGVDERVLRRVTR
jgi:hypothetical protein